MKKQKNEITLKGLFNIFLPKWWMILIVSLLFAVILGGYSLMKDDAYTSSGKYMISKVNYSNSNAQTGLTTSEVEAMHIMISNADEMIKTNNFANVVVERLKAYGITSYSASQIKSMMSVTLTSTDTTCYSFSVTSSDPKHSHAIAEVAGQLLVEEYKNKTVYAIEIYRIDDPVVPKSPNSKNVARNALIGFAGGFLLSLIFVFILSRFDIVIRSRDKIEENFDLPILGVIPRLEIDS